MSQAPKLSILWGIMCLILPLAKAQQDRTFRNITEGLASQNRITSIIQDHRGFIWIGTYGGISRYDGFNFRNYEFQRNTAKSLPGNQIVDMKVDEAGNLWIGTTKGLARYDEAADNFKIWKSSPEGLWDNRITRLFQGTDGRLWIGTYAGLNYLQGDEIKRSQHLAGQRIAGISNDSRGRLLVASRQDLYVLEDGKRPVSVSGLLELNLTNIYCMLAGKNGDIWLGTEGSGAYKINVGGNPTYENYVPERGIDKSLSSRTVLSLLEDRDRRIWLGTENGGLCYYNSVTNGFERYTSDSGDPGSLSSNSIWSLFEDKTGRFWVGTFNQGVDTYDPYEGRFGLVQQIAGNAQGLSNNAVSAFAFVENKLWIGTDGGGVNVWDRETGKFKIFKNNTQDNGSIGSNAVLAIFEDSRGDLWLGTWAGGLNRFNSRTQTFRKYFNDPNNPKSLSSNNVFDIKEDRRGNLWIGTFGGLNLFDPKTSEVVRIENEESNQNSLSSNEVLSLLVDNRDNIWVGTQWGLNRVRYGTPDDITITRYLQDESNPGAIANNVINDIYQDNAGRIWVGTKEGLCLLRGEEFIIFDKSNGLPSYEILSIFQDKDNKFWITTSKGLSEMSETNGGFSFKNYNADDGLQSSSFIRGSYLVSAKGEVFIGGNKGFNFFFPDQMSANTEPSPVELTDFKIFNQSVVPGDNSVLDASILVTQELSLNHTHSVFSIDYAGLALTNANKNNYAYRLVGFEEEWNQVGTQRSATYTSLDPGTYTFEVKSSNSDGVWTETPRQLIIVVNPPWWGTWWFRSFMAMVVIGMVIAFYRGREKRRRVQEKLLKDQVKEATDQIATQNAVLEGQKELLSKAIAETNFIINHAVENGDFEIRLEADDKEGEWKELATSINLLFDAIVAPLKSIQKITQALSKGDLTQRYEEEASGQILTLKTQLNDSLDSLEGLLGQMQTMSGTISDSTKDMQVTAEEMHNNTLEISASVGQISSGAADQLSKVDRASTLINLVNDSAKDIDKQASSINNKAQESAGRAEQAVEDFKELTGHVGKVLEMSNGLLTAFKALSDKSKAITAVTQLIREISSRTNMLSLNASIQAAQAGESGRGFAVVAEEIRKLAENSKASIDEIENFVEDMQKSIEETSKTVGVMNTYIDGNRTLSTKNLAVFQSVLESFQETLAASMTILQYTQKQSQDLEEVAVLSGNVVVIAEETAAGSEEVAASTSELSAGMAQYTSKSGELKDIIAELRRNTARFTLRVSGKSLTSSANISEELTPNANNEPNLN